MVTAAPFPSGGHAGKDQRGRGQARRGGGCNGGTYAQAGLRVQLGSGRARVQQGKHPEWSRRCNVLSTSAVAAGLERRPGHLTYRPNFVAVRVHPPLSGAAIWPYQQVSIVGLRYACFSAAQGLQYGSSMAKVHASDTLGA